MLFWAGTDRGINYPLTQDDFYQLTVDTPGTWDFALLAVPTKQVGRITRELPAESMLEKFTLNVHEAGALDVKESEGPAA